MRLTTRVSQQMSHALEHRSVTCASQARVRVSSKGRAATPNSTRVRNTERVESFALIVQLITSVRAKNSFHPPGSIPLLSSPFLHSHSSSRGTPTSFCWEEGPENVTSRLHEHRRLRPIRRPFLENSSWQSRSSTGGNNGLHHF